MDIIKADSEKHIGYVRDLFLEYAGSLEFDLCFQDFDNELKTLPGGYAPPAGALLLAMHRGIPAGCVALRKLSGTICELKRLYVRNDFRNMKIGWKLTSEIVNEAKKLGYRSMRLDTLPSMERAVSLYRSMGFKEIDPYRHNPIEGALYMELDLSGVNPA